MMEQILKNGLLVLLQLQQQFTNIIMLREENFEQKKYCLNTMSSQTEQFLLFTAIQKKLQDVYKKYKQLQDNYDESLIKIDYLEYKIKYLESSLFETTYIFRNDRVDSNLEHLKDIQQLNDIIQIEKKELDNIQNFVLSRISYEQSDRQQQKFNLNNVSFGEQKKQQIQQTCLGNSKKHRLQNCMKTEIKNQFSKQKIVDEIFQIKQSQTPLTIYNNNKDALKKQSAHHIKEKKQINLIKKESKQNASVDSQKYRAQRSKLTEVILRQKKESKYFSKPQKQKSCQQKLINIQAQLRYKHFIDQFAEKNKYGENSILQDSKLYGQLFKQKKQAIRQCQNKLAFSLCNKINSYR